MDTISNIRLAEAELLGFAIHRLRIIFKSSSLTGHNTDHHLRVWKNASGIAEALSLKGEYFTLKEIKELMLAALFHDTGMIYETGERHGNAGAELFLTFDEFKGGDIEVEKVAMAIEKHDDKSYLNGTGERRSTLTILTTADDMDAFGIIGFLRYMEIYSHRDISSSRLAQHIIKNASSRFSHFRDTWSDLDQILSETTKRYNTLCKCCRAIENPGFSRTMQLFAERSFTLAGQEENNLYTAATTLLNSEFTEVREIAGTGRESISDML
ncbi:MAG: HD domain-containing protein [Bacteroidales bacterium]|nr:HD domain-containing protein [Bacteroidales bacterium]